MTIRPFDLLDLPTLYRYRGEAVSLDAARLLTRGNPLGAIGAMAYMNPQRHLYAAVSTGENATLVGGVIHTNGDPFAKLLYLAPASHMEHPALPALIESLAAEAGTWGAFHVVAELKETGEAFAPLRRAGFSVYAWQRMWNVTTLASGNSNGNWGRASSVHLPAIQSLHHQIVPPLLQAVEPAPRRATGYFCDEGVPCHVSTSSGLKGIVMFPLIHPETVDVPGKLASLIDHISNRGGRPIYVCVRSYQAWLENMLEDLGAQAGERQAILVKHLTHRVKAEQTVRAAQPAGVSVQPSRVSRLQEKKQRL
jgi:hypothetical protein